MRDPEDWFRSLETFTAKRYGAPSGGITRQMIEQDSYLYPGYSAGEHVHAFLQDPPSYRPGEDSEPKVRWDKLFDRERYIGVYERRNDEVREHFKARPGQLLEIDLTREATIQKVVDFLGLPPELGAADVPHRNAT